MSERTTRLVLIILLIVYGIWVLTPFLAPVFMKIGWQSAANSIYLLYSVFCHQLPQRSFFLFGEKTMYSLAEIQQAWKTTGDPLSLRRFIGNLEMGWKVAWSDRMVAFYTAIWFFSLWRWRLRPPHSSRANPRLLLFLLPMVLDGVTHFISDLSGLERGFRTTNGWLVSLTGNILPPWFYAGDALGSFNSWMRLLSGLLAAWGIVEFLRPYWFVSQETTSIIIPVQSIEGYNPDRGK
uniref:DUF2085 domain-containing protein n=1 Tax=Bellilinea caldifistulae TaxID=360411 RepID=A0A7C4L206_9CHLR